jgi:hypothetical protein
MSRLLHDSLTFVHCPLENTGTPEPHSVVFSNDPADCRIGTRLAWYLPNFSGDIRPEHAMDIRIISSLTPEDEARIASALMSALTNLLDQLPIRYAVRFETAAGKRFTREHSPVEVPLGDASLDVPADALLSFKIPRA